MSYILIGTYVLLSILHFLKKKANSMYIHVLYICINTLLYICVRINTHTCTCICVQVHIQIHVHEHEHIRMYST
jgi:hypothetical protein